MFRRSHLAFAFAAPASIVAGCASEPNRSAAPGETPVVTPTASLGDSGIPPQDAGPADSGTPTNAGAPSLSDGGSSSPGAARDASAAGDGAANTLNSSGTDAGSGEGPLADGLMAFPAPNSQGVCPDPPLRITFPSPPQLGTSGMIQVFDTSQTATAAASVDMAATTFVDTIGGTTFNTVRPVYIDGNDVVVYLKSHALTYGRTYYVTIDPGAIVPPTGTLSITGATAWRFSTAAAPPTSLTSLTVALNGSGNFCSVQGAVDALPAGNTAATQILIENGIYHEIVHFASKNNVTLLGESRTGTIIEGTNNNDMNPSTVGRSLVGIDGSNGLVVDTMTITNLTPQGGSQAEALRLETCDECIVRNANVNSLQDTLLWDGRLYADNCTISGNVDFVWGGGVAYFNDCIIHTTGQAGAIVQARNAASAYGYVFVDSQLTADPQVEGQVLARIDVSEFPGSQVAYVNCTMGSFISPAGWTITGGTPTSTLRFWEYQSVDPSGNAIDVSQRIAGSIQISAAQAVSLRDPTVVLSGWQPQ